MPHNRPKHLAMSASKEQDKRPRTRVLRTATGAVMAGLLSLPGNAFAASSIYVGADTYTEAANGSGANGGTWSWDGADDMLLNNYDGWNIGATGDLTITLEGENSITGGFSPDYSPEFQAQTTGIEVQGETTDGWVTDIADIAELEITGDGSLTIEQSGEGILANNATITVDGAEVTVEATMAGIVSQINAPDSGPASGDITIENGAKVQVSVDRDRQSEYQSEFDSGVVAGHVNVSDSTLSATSTTAYGVYAGVQSYTNSVVSAEGGSGALVSRAPEGSITINNSDLTAKVKNGATTQGLSAQANSASDGAAVTALGKIELNNVSGVTVAQDENGVSYLTDESGSTDITTSHTGEDSKFANGVGNASDSAEQNIPEDQTNTESTSNENGESSLTDESGSAEITTSPTGEDSKFADDVDNASDSAEQSIPEDQTSTESTSTEQSVNTVQSASTVATAATHAPATGTAKATAAIPATSDPTSFVGMISSLLGGVALTVTGARRRRVR